MNLILLLALVVLAVEPMAFEQPHFKQGVLLVLGPLVLLPGATFGRLRGTARAPLSWPLLAFAGLFAWSATIGPHAATNLPEAFRSIATLLVLLVLLVAVHDDGWLHPRRIPIAVLVLGAAAGALALLQTAGVDFPFGDPFDQDAAVSTFGNTNLTGEFLAPIVPLALVTLAGGRGIARGTAAIALPLAVGGLVATESRGALLAAVAGVVAAPFLARGLVARRTLGPASIGLLAVGAALAFGAGGADAFRMKAIASDASILSSDYPPNRQRALLLAASIDMTRARPIVGHGPGNFRAAFPPFRDPAEAALEIQGARTEAEDPHNQYALLAAEGGVVALLLFLAFLLPALLAFRHAAILPDDDPRKAIAPALAAALLALLVVGLFRAPQNHPPSALLLVALAGSLLPYRDSILSDGSRRHRSPLDLILPLYLVAALFVGVKSLGADTLMAWSARRLEQAIEKGDVRYKSEAGHFAAWARTLDDANPFLLQYSAEMLRRDPGRTSESRDEEHRLRRRMLELYPHHRDTLLRLAALALEDGRVSAARGFLRRALRVRAETDPNDPVRLLAATGHDSAATRLLLDEVANGTEPATTLLARADEAERRGDRTLALVCYDALLAVHAYDGDAAFEAGRLLRDQGHEAQSERLFARAHVAFALEKLGQRNYDAARKSANLATRHLDTIEAEVVLALADAAEGGAARLDALLAGDPALAPAFLEALSRLDGVTELKDAIDRLIDAR